MAPLLIMKPNYKQFGRFLRTYRRNHRLSQEALAKKAGLKKLSIHYYENEQRKPTIESIFKLSIAMNIHPDCIFSYFCD